MSKVPFTNTGNTPIYSADGKLVPPGETRMIDAPLAPAAEATPEPDPVLGLLDNKIEDIVPHLAGMDGDALARLLKAEQDGKTRKTLIGAIELRIMEVEDAAKLAAADGQGAGEGAGEGAGQASGDAAGDAEGKGAEGAGNGE